MFSDLPITSDNVTGFLIGCGVTAPAVWAFLQEVLLKKYIEAATAPLQVEISYLYHQVNELRKASNLDPIPEPKSIRNEIVQEKAKE